MKKTISILSLVFCLCLACICMSACFPSKEDYENLNTRYNELLEEKNELEKLNTQYDELLKEKNELEKISAWFDLYNSIEIDKSYDQISTLFNFDYSNCTKVWGENSHTMEAYTWKNNDLFERYDLEENQITVVFCDGISIFKQYGDQNLIIDNDKGIIIFPFHNNAV